MGPNLQKPSLPSKILGYVHVLFNNPYQMQYVPFVIQQVYFQNKTLLAHQNTKKHIHCVESFNRDDYVRQAATQMGDAKLWAKLSEGYMIAREACYQEHCKTKFRNKFANFCNDQENHIKDVQKSLAAIAVADCMLLIKGSLQNIDQVAHLIRNLQKIIQKFYCYCLENTRRISSCNKTGRIFIKTLSKLRGNIT